jgi:hypothetical protein
LGQTLAVIDKKLGIDGGVFHGAGLFLKGFKIQVKQRLRACLTI